MTTRASHKARGKGFETDLLKHLREMGYTVERLALAGSKDEGDLVLKQNYRDFIIEAKAPGAGNSIDLSGWLNEADVELNHYNQARGIEHDNNRRLVVIKARGKGIQDAYVVQRLSDLFPKE